MCFRRQLGFFVLLDEESRFPKATDATLGTSPWQSPLSPSHPMYDLRVCCCAVEKLKTNLSSSANFVPARTSAPEFTIKHYAGDVTYTSFQFLVKNRDQLPPAVIKVLMPC